MTSFWCVLIFFHFNPSVYKNASPPTTALGDYLSTTRRKILLTVTDELANHSFPQLPQNCAELITVQPVAMSDLVQVYSHVFQAH
jgi:hypothetical protein